MTTTFIVTFASVFAATVAFLFIWILWRERILRLGKEGLRLRELQQEGENQRRLLDALRTLDGVKISSERHAFGEYLVRLEAPGYSAESAACNASRVEETVAAMEDRYREWLKVQPPSKQDHPDIRRALRLGVISPFGAMNIAAERNQAKAKSRGNVTCLTITDETLKADAFNILNRMDEEDCEYVIQQDGVSVAVLMPYEARRILAEQRFANRAEDE